MTATPPLPTDALQSSGVHTSGPWVAARVHGGEGYVHTVRAAGVACTPAVAMVWDDNDDPAIPSADARLIAAAPDLLRELRKARDVINALYVGMAISDEGRAVNLARFDAAIAKALGK